MLGMVDVFLRSRSENSKRPVGARGMSEERGNSCCHDGQVHGICTIHPRTDRRASLSEERGRPLTG